LEPDDYYRYTKYGLKYLFEQNGLIPKKIIPMDGKFALMQLLFADYVLRCVESIFKNCPRWLRIMIYQIILLPSAILIYPIANTNMVEKLKLRGAILLWA